MNPHKKYSPMLRKTLEYCFENKLIIIDADKGMGCTLCDLDWYREQVFKHLKSSAFTDKEIDTQSILDSREQVLEYLTLFKTEKGTRKDLAKRFQKLDHETIIDMVPDFYAMPKLHKNPVSTRPICPSTGWITSTISRVIDRQLQPIVNEFPWNLRDTPTFIRNTENIRVPEGSFLLSFDIESMYTKIGNNEAIARIKLAIGKTMFSAQKDALVHMIKWVLSNNYVRFQGNTFQQTQGVAMGTPMAPTYASLFMCQYESQFFAGPTINGTSWSYLGPLIKNLYFRYIDDGLIIWPWGEELAMQFLQDFPANSPSINLTYKIGQCLLYLDL